MKRKGLFIISIVIFLLVFGMSRAHPSPLQLQFDLAPIGGAGAHFYGGPMDTYFGTLDMFPDPPWLPLTGGPGNPIKAAGLGGKAKLTIGWGSPVVTTLSSEGATVGPTGSGDPHDVVVNPTGLLWSDIVLFPSSPQVLFYETASAGAGTDFSWFTGDGISDGEYVFTLTLFEVPAPAGTPFGGTGRYTQKLLDSVGGDDVDVYAVTYSEISPIPEPATTLLLGSGLIGLAGFRRKFRKK